MPKSKPPRKKSKKRKSAAGAKGGRRIGRDAPLPDRRAVEGYLASLLARTSDSPLDAAQDLMYEAWDAPTRRERVALARKALRLSPQCADAYVLLAEETARSGAEAVDLYRRGVEAGELALGEETFKEDVGYFWGILETRPYMRARCGLAQALWCIGEREEAITHYRDMLRLNPNDNQGIRYLLAACLLDMGRDDDLDALLKEYDGDGSAAWTFTQALAAFRRGGDSENSRRLLADALASNAHVPNYLLGLKGVPRAAPQYVSMGGEDEAAEYVRCYGAGWKATPGAIAWLAEALSRLPKPRRGRGRR